MLRSVSDFLKLHCPLFFLFFPWSALGSTSLVWFSSAVHAQLRTILPGSPVSLHPLPSACCPPQSDSLCCRHGHPIIPTLTGAHRPRPLWLLHVSVHHLCGSSYICLLPCFFYVLLRLPVISHRRLVRTSVTSMVWVHCHHHGVSHSFFPSALSSPFQGAFYGFLSGKS